MKKFFIGVVIILIAGLGLDHYKEPMTLLPGVENYVTEVSENYINETIACLDYVEIGHHLVIYDYNVPTHYKATNDYVLSDKCNVGQMPIHNHPSMKFTESLKDYYYEGTGDSLVSRDQMLYLSKGDIKSAVRFYHKYTGVMANGRMTYWTRAQYRSAFLNKLTLLKPIPNQIWTE